MKIKSIFSYCLVLFTITAMLISIAGCSGTSNKNTLSSIAVTSDTTGNLAVGVTRQLKATGTYSDGTTADISGKVTWKSSNTGVAKIYSQGLITGSAAGSTEITASLSGITSQALQVNIIVRKLLSIEISPSPPPDLAIGAYAQFTVTGKYDDGSTSDFTLNVTWSSSDNNVATITKSTGLVQGKSIGKTNISATIDGMTAKSIELTVAQDVLSSITVTPSVLDTLPVGSTQQFEALGNYSNNTTDSLTSSVTWTSSDTSVATISSTGLVTAVSAGITKISATLSGVTSDVVILPVSVLQSVAVKPGEASTIAVGTTQSFIALATYADGSVAAVTSKATWSSSDTSTATIAISGIATGVAEGNANISATFAGIASPSVPLKILTLSSIAITPASPPILAAKAIKQFSATGTYSDGSTVNLTSKATWTSSNVSVATVASGGFVTGVIDGQTNITAAFATITSSAVVVKVVTLSSIAITPSSLQDFKVGATQQYTATGTFVDGTITDLTADVSWISSDTSVASIDIYGVAEAVKAGTATINAKYAEVTSTDSNLKVVD